MVVSWTHHGENDRVLSPAPGAWNLQASAWVFAHDSIFPNLGVSIVLVQPGVQIRLQIDRVRSKGSCESRL